MANQRRDNKFQHRVLEVRRVSRVMKGGRRINFRALVVVGDEDGQVGYGLGKAEDVRAAIDKARDKAKENLVDVYIEEGTIPYRVEKDFKGAEILIKPASPGTGVIAGGTMRVVLELAGIKDVVAKSLGSNNKLSVTKATVKVLDEMRSPEEIKEARGINQ